MLLYAAFNLSSDHPWRQFLARIRQNFIVEKVPAPQGKRLYVDSFDGRFQRRSEVSSIDIVADEMHLLWFSLAGAKALPPVAVQVLPRFASDLPSGSVRNIVSKRIPVRALLPFLSIEIRTQKFHVQDLQNKQLVVLDIETLLPADSAITQKALLLVQITAANRFRKMFAEICEIFQGISGLRPLVGDDYYALLTSVGANLRTHASSNEIILTREMRSDAALYQLCIPLASVILENETGVREAVDSEFLHDFRVAVRKTRSALGQIKQVLPARTTQKFVTEFRWLAKMTSAARDLDVTLQEFATFRENLSPELVEALVPLRHLIQRRQALAYQELARRLTGTRYKRLMKSWEQQLNTPPPQRSRLINARRPILLVASERISHLYRKVRKQGRAIYKDSPAETLHALRKSCKKLRYLLEFFQSLYPPDDIKSIVSKLKTLQETLGSFQDATVRIAALRTYALSNDDHKLPAETLLAMGCLLAGFIDKQASARDELACRFKDFSARKNRDDFQRLFGRKALANYRSAIDRCHANLDPVDSNTSPQVAGCRKPSHS